MEEGEGFRHGSEDLGGEDSEDNTHSVGHMRRNARGPAHPGRSGSRVRPTSPAKLQASAVPRSCSCLMPQYIAARSQLHPSDGGACLLCLPDDSDAKKLSVPVLCPGHGGALTEEPGGVDAQPEAARGRGGRGRSRGHPAPHLLGRPRPPRRHWATLRPRQHPAQAQACTGEPLSPLRHCACRSRGGSFCTLML